MLRSTLVDEDSHGYSVNMYCEGLSKRIFNILQVVKWNFQYYQHGVWSNRVPCKKKCTHHKAYLKSYLTQNVFVNSLMTDSTDANAMHQESNLVSVKLATKKHQIDAVNFQW